jgi:hypothetical protein
LLQNYRELRADLQSGEGTVLSKFSSFRAISIPPTKDGNSTDDVTAAPKHPKWGYGYIAALISSAFLAHAVWTAGRNRQGDGARFIKVGQTYGHY